MQKIDWAKLDESANIRNKPAILKKAKKFGFKYISEYIYTRHEIEKKAMRRVAEELGLSFHAPTNWYKKWGFKVNVTRGNVKNLVTSEEKEAIKALFGTCKAKEAAEKMNRSTETIRNIWWEIKPPRKTLKGVIPVKTAKKHTGEATKYERVAFSKFKNRGLSRLEIEKYNRNLEFEAWKAHRGDTPIPLPEKTMRIGEYANF